MLALDNRPSSSFATAPSVRVPDDALRASIARDDLLSFVREYWDVVEPGVTLSWNWHHELICDELTHLTRVLIDNDLTAKRREMINIPPGCSKSLIVSVFWPSWMWARWPHLRYLFFSYSDANTIRDNRKCRNIVTSEKYQRHYALRLDPAQSGKTRFDTVQRGFRIASSIGGVGTGEHPHVIVTDDPLKALDADSDVKRAECIEFSKGTISTRRALNPIIVLIMQRLHMDDLSGYYRRTDIDAWNVLCLPMRYKPTDTAAPDPAQHYHAHPRDPRTHAGELLWPEVWTESKTRQLEYDLGPFGVAGQLQQAPIPVGGGLFKREWFKVVDALPNGLIYARGWDIAESEPNEGEEENTNADWTAGVKVGLDPVTRNIYIVHCIAAQSTLVDGLILATAALDGRVCRVREGAGSGKSTIKARAKLLQRFDYAAMPETESKVSRAKPFRGQCEAGNVFIVQGEWTARYLDELCAFPVGRHDDRVDASANAYNALVGEVGMTGAMW